jgi:hypothetical protein
MKTTTRKNETTINRRIELLEKQSDIIREELESELNLARQKATGIGKVALGIGGGLLLSMLIFRVVFQKKNEHAERPHNKRVYHKFRDQLLGEISSQALLFILGVAKDKIRTHLEQEKSGEE